MVQRDILQILVKGKFSSVPLNSSSEKSAAQTIPNFWLPLGFLLVGVAIASAISPESIDFMLQKWQKEEYSHSYLIPFIALALIWRNLPLLGDRFISPSWVGVALVVALAALLLLGELSALYTIVNYAYFGILIGLVVATLGLRAALLLGAPLLYLFFMVPLPNFLYFNLSQSLQLISSDLGVWVIRLFGISVFLEGNVIDLGAYKLQVVEACSGLRYLFPLASFGFLVAYLFQAPLWQRALVFVSTLPITVLMNSFRIGVIGVLVEHWGIGMADGFLHYFEGWVIFIACLAVLFAEIWLLNRLFGDAKSIWDRIDLDLPSVSEVSLRFQSGVKAVLPLIGSILVLLVTWGISQSLAERTELTPTRTSFTQFPLLHKGWIGRESNIEANVLRSLKLTDHLIADYREPGFAMPVNLYIAYYDSQRKGASIHSPKSCLPGGGWEMQSLTQVPLDTVVVASANGDGLSANRAVIQKGQHRQLVYYWFEQRGRRLTNEYLVKWYLFVDSLLQKRSDGALVRMVVPVPDGVPVDQADAQLQQFLRDFYPILTRYVPD